MKSTIFKIAGTLAIAAFIFSCAPEEATNNNTSPTDPKAKWIGSWTCQETAGANPGTYTIHISDSVGTTYVTIENLYNSGFQTKVKGNISSSNITIANQPLGSGAYTIYGSGSMVSNTSVNLNFSVNDGSTIDNVTALLTKQ